MFKKLRFSRNARVYALRTVGAGGVILLLASIPWVAQDNALVAGVFAGAILMGVLNGYVFFGLQIDPFENE